MIKKIPKNTASFTYFNANPKDKRSSDCVLRAISLASGKSWDEVLNIRKCRMIRSVMGNTLKV